MPDKDMKMVITVSNEGVLYNPVLAGEVQWSTEREGSPGKLTFTVVKDDKLNIQEGNEVRMIFEGNNVFFGYVFEKNRDKGKTIKIIAYDQLRYLKNKDICTLLNMTAGEFLKVIANNFLLRCGDIADTGWVIESRLFDNKTLFDIIQETLDETLTNTKKLYVLYDDYGKLALKNIEDMRVKILFDKNVMENFDYTSSIDGETYNRIKLYYDDGDSGIRFIHSDQSEETIAKWGVLQYCDTADSKEGLIEKAKVLLELYNKKTRKLSLKNVLGDWRVRAGCGVKVNLGLVDINVDAWFVCESVTHTYKDNEHLMDVTLWGNDFIG